MNLKEMFLKCASAAYDYNAVNTKTKVSVESSSTGNFFKLVTWNVTEAGNSTGCEIMLVGEHWEENNSKVENLLKIKL